VVTGKQIKWLKRIVIALVIYGVVGFLVLPPIIKWQLVKRLPAMTQRAVRIDGVGLNPFALSLSLHGFSLTESDGTPFIACSNLYVNFEAFGSLWNRAWTFNEIELVRPYGYIAWITNSEFNFSDLLTNSTPAAPKTSVAKPLPRVLIHSFVITNGAIEFDDFTRLVPFHTEFTPIDVRLTEFTTRPATDTPYSFTAVTGERESFSWSGDFTVVPLTSYGRFELNDIELKKYGPYLAEFAQFDMRDGKIDVAATYQLAVGTNGLDLSVTNASLAVTNLLVRVPLTENKIAEVPGFAVRGADANLLQRNAHVKSIETAGGKITARRDRNGELQILALAKPDPKLASPTVAATSTNTAAAPAVPWSLSIEKFSVTNFAVAVEDAQPATMARLLADQISLTLTNLSLASNAPLGGEISARLDELGKIKLVASAVITPPLRAECDVDVSEIQLRSFQPYVREQAKLAITRGSLTTKGHANIFIEGTNAPQIHFVGDVAVKDFASVDQIVFQDFAKWKEVALRGLDISLNPLAVKLEELSCDQLTSAVVLDTNRQPTFLAMLLAKTNATNVATASTSTTPATNAAPLNVQLGLLSLTNASLQFADFSVQPPCKFVVQNFSGTVKGLSSALDTAADVDITGSIGEGAPFAISGKVNPLASDLLVDLVISNRNMELTSFTPYMEKFAGHPLKKGKLSVALRYNVKQHELKAENVVLIDQLTLGQKNNSPDATHLPVKLGVALLKDRNGKIELNVPVNGRLDDPKFSVVPIIWQVVMNMLAKAATSPFALLGALVGGGEELSFVEFTPGQSTISETESPKIEKLGRALFERPALNIEVTGSADEVLDRAGLAWLKLETELKTVRLAELAGKNGAPASTEEIQIVPREYPRLLRALYKKTFNRTRPLPVDATTAANNVTSAKTNIILNPTATRPDARKGAENLMSREVARTPDKTTNAMAGVVDPRVATRPASLPALAPDDDVLARMESELFTRMEVSESDLRDLMQQRAQSVQRALLRTEKVEGERIFILAPKAPDAASKGESRVNLSLN